MGWNNSDPGFVYLIAWNDLHKIGISRKVRKRVREICRHHSGATLVHTIAVEQMSTLEWKLHERYANKRRHGEWFALSPQDVAEICAL